MDGINGGGNELHLTNSESNLVKIDGLQTVNRPNLNVNTVDTTDQDSGNIMEFAAGLADPGELNFQVKYVPGSPTDLLLSEHLASFEKRPFKIILKTDGETNQEVTGQCLITAYEPDEAAVGDLRTASCTAKVSGATTQAAAA